MNQKQQRFVDEYLIDLNATQAAIRAGYAPKFAGTNADKLLKNTKVAVAITKAQQKLSERAEITQEMVMADIEAIKRDAMQTIKNDAGLSVMLSHKDALKACELQGRRLGMFSDKLNIGGQADNPVQVNATVESAKGWLSEIISGINGTAEK